MVYRARKSLRLVVSLAVLAVVGLALVNNQAIYDWARLRNYHPSAEVVQLATNITMDDYARHLFFVYHPNIEDKSSFGSHCQQDEQTIVLGCYIKNRGIYIFNVQDPRLRGIKEVTAAHEFLHAAYDRLSNDERKRVNDLINQAYANLNNQRISNTVDAYRRAGVDTINELHSILGTEVRSLPAELENYYKKYFDNRVKIVDYSDNYEKAFTDKKAQQEELLNQINTLKSELTNQKQTIEHEEQALEDEYRNLQQLATSGQTNAYNSRVAGYNARAAAIQSSMADFNQKVDLVNRLINEYNQLGTEQAELFQAIDSRSAPQTQ